MKESDKPTKLYKFSYKSGYGITCEDLDNKPHNKNYGYIHWQRPMREKLIQIGTNAKENKRRKSQRNHRKSREIDIS